MNTATTKTNEAENDSYSCPVDLVYQLELPWPGATGNTQARHGKRGSYLNPLVAKYRQIVAQVAAAHGWGGWDGRKPLGSEIKAGQGVGSQKGKKTLLGRFYELDLLAAPPDARARDADNVAKVLCDSLVHAGVLADDSNRVIRTLTIQWTDPVPGGRVLVTIQLHNATEKT